MQSKQITQTKFAIKQLRFLEEIKKLCLDFNNYFHNEIPKIIYEWFEFIRKSILNGKTVSFVVGTNDTWYCITMDFNLNKTHASYYCKYLVLENGYVYNYKGWVIYIGNQNLVFTECLLKYMSGMLIEKQRKYYSNSFSQGVVISNIPNHKPV